MERKETPSRESREGGPWAGGKFLLLRMLREGRRKGEKIKSSWKAPGRWRKEKGRRERRRERRGSGRLVRRDVAHRQASWKVGSRSTGSGEVIKGRTGTQKDPQPLRSPAGTRQAPSLQAQRIPSPTAEAAQQERGRCQPCPGELGAGAAEDGAQPTSCPPPPSAGKML